MGARFFHVALALATLVAGVAGGSGVARAEPSVAATTASTPGEGLTTTDASDPSWTLRRKHTIAELELGFIALPSAPISSAVRGGNLPLGATIGHGDATASVGMHLLFRGGPDWAIGAGALFCPTPTSDSSTTNGIIRSHSRDYLWMGGEARYIPLHLRTVEAWVGIVVGGVVIADRFTTDTPAVPSDLGTAQVTVRTEGLSVGLQAGGDWELGEHVLIGLALRFDNWILPADLQGRCTPIGDCPSLSGPVTEIEFGIRLGYRIPL